MITFGMIPSPEDERDWQVPDRVMTMTVAQEFHTPYRPIRRNQGGVGTCVAESMAQWTEANELRERGVRIEYSEGFIYGNRGEKDFKGEGMIPREMLLQMVKHGTVRRPMMPFRAVYPTCSKYIVDNAGNLKDEGFPARIRGFVRLRTMDDVYAYMSEFQVGILIGLSCDAAWSQMPSSGMVPPYVGPSIGGHMMYVTDIVDKGGLRLRVQNTWGPTWGDNGDAYVDITKCSRLEMWGPLPDESAWYTGMPNEIMLSLNKDQPRRDYMIVDGVRVTIPVGPFYHDGKMCTAIREPFEAMGAKVEWVRLPGGTDHVTIRPRKGQFMK